MLGPELLRTILDGYVLPTFGLHGIGHWARVLENGVRLAEDEGGRVEVVRLFAVFHDARRWNDGHDPDHGPRGAELARKFRGTAFDLPDDDFERLYIACEEHTHTRHHDDVTVQCCFDADRLDLGRVGIRPDVRYLNTAAAKSNPLRAWALERSRIEFVPAFVVDDWGLDPTAEFRP